jgi:CheY-like chemotaxis protein
MPTNIYTGSKKIRVLFLEDNARDAELNARALEEAGFELEWTRVESEADFLAAIATRPDLIVSDYGLPQFDGMKAVELLRARQLDIPFILVSGTVGEEVAVLAMKRGADDYLLKDRLARLGGAAAQALQRKRGREDREQAETARAAAETRLRELAETQTAILNALPAAIALLNPEGMILAVNEVWRQFAGANALPGTQAAIGQNYLTVCDSAVGDCAGAARAAAAGIRRVLRGEENEFVLEYACPAPTEPRWFQLLVTPQRREQIAGAVVMHTNITHRVRAELERQQLEQRLRQAEKLASLGQLAASIARDLNPPPGSGAAPEPARDFTSLLAHYEKLLQAAKGEAAAPELIVEAAAARAQVDEQVLLNLCQLLISLAPVAGEKPAPPAAPGPAGADPQSQQLYAALEETIAVLEQTKRSFKSRSLGQLRAKLAKLISPRA